MFHNVHDSPVALSAFILISWIWFHMCITALKLVLSYTLCHSYHWVLFAISATEYPGECPKITEDFVLSSKAKLFKQKMSPAHCCIISIP